MRSMDDVRAKMSEMGIEPKKALGQNFLINQHVIAKIVDEVKRREFAALVEIGPGLGALTEPLLAAGLKPRLIELDREFVAYWRGRDMDVTEADALKVNWDS